MVNQLDFYMIFENFYNRLESEYKKYGKLIIAVDYDDTIYDYHNSGRNYDCVIDLLRRWKDHAEIIIFTSSAETRFDEMRKYLDEHSIPYNAINEELSASFGGRKVYANVHIDDRGGIETPYKALSMLADKIERDFKG